MADQIGSGVEYPKLTIDGREYEVKFSRAAIYRLDKSGFDLRLLAGEVRGWLPSSENGIETPGRVRYSVMIDILHAAVGDQLRCTAEQLAELVGPERTAEVAAAILGAMVKTKPSPQTQGQETAAPVGPAVQ